MESTVTNSPQFLETLSSPTAPESNAQSGVTSPAASKGSPAPGTPNSGITPPRKRSDLILTPAEALEKAKKLPKGYAIVPELQQQKKEPLATGPLPQKRERKRINYNDFVTSPKSKIKDEKKEGEEGGVSPEAPMKTPKPKKRKKNGVAPPPFDFQNESLLDQESDDETPSSPHSALKGRRGSDGKKKIEHSIKLLDSRLEELTKSLHHKKQKEREGDPDESKELIAEVDVQVDKKKASTIRPQRTKKRRRDFGPITDYQLTAEMKQCLNVLNSIMAHRLAWPFNQPVDPVALNIPDYFDIIKTPMDLGTIKKQLESGWYENYEEFADDVRLVFSNATTYNPPRTDIWIMATTLSELFEKKLGQTKKKLEEKTVTLEMEETISELRDSMKLVREEIRKLRHQKAQSGFPLPTPSKFSKGGRAPKDDQPMTFDEKKKLGDSINTLPADRLGRVVSIIHERIPHLAKNTGSDEIEIDIDVLDTGTLRALERYVRSITHPKKKKSKSSGGAAEGLMMKHAELSENGTAKKIMDVERQLKELNNLSQSYNKKATNVRGKKKDSKELSAVSGNAAEKGASSSGSDSESDSDSSGSGSSSSSSDSDSRSDDENEAHRAVAPSQANTFSSQSPSLSNPT